MWYTPQTPVGLCCNSTFKKTFIESIPMYMYVDAYPIFVDDVLGECN